MYKIIEQMVETSNYSGIIYTVLDQNNDVMVRFTTKKQAEAFIKECETFDKAEKINFMD